MTYVKGSINPRKGRHWKRAQRIEIVAKLEAQFIADADIAIHLGIAESTVASIKRTPEYQAARLRNATHVLSVYDSALLATDEAKKDAIADLIPNALHAVKHVLETPSHPQFARVALDILDRNKATSKISRTEHTLAPIEQPAEQNERANALLKMLQGEDVTGSGITIPPSVAAGAPNGTSPLAAPSAAAVSMPSLNPIDAYGSSSGRTLYNAVLGVEDEDTNSEQVSTSAGEGSD